MASIEQENQALTEQFQSREAGVIDLFEFYARLEAVYAAASKALEQSQIGTASNSANLE